MTNGTNNLRSVTFPITFNSAPTVLLTPKGNVTAQYSYSASLVSVGTTSATAYLYYRNIADGNDAGKGSDPLYYLAIGY